MSNKVGSSALIAMKLLGGATALAATILIVTTAVTFAPRQAGATPAYASQTKLPCGQCHVTATGGPTNAFGKAFADNGHKVPPKN